ncbi:hypothetical protein EB796_016457 [Bugula neritina]|uniref:GST C-terminal domain-containing protein n=1 Tax=Bugula neritina TaxID=10212 RepID=A0A7J7JGU7_BUGNE|nr:hypothetical protein EB796_016457 [Bugula neritina]
MSSASKDTKYNAIKGAFVRGDSTFRNWIKADGSTQFPPEANRYHLYVSYACPWANRTLILRSMKGLQKIITVDVVDWLLDMSKGWQFSPEKKGCTPDTVKGCKSLRDVYGGDGYTGKVTVPVLYDKKMNVIVNNESSEILRMLNSEFNDFCETPEQRDLNLYPESLRAKIDAINEWIYPMVNNGVYKSGFAKSQEAYDAAVTELFQALDQVEEILSKNRYLTGDSLTEADIRLFVTLVRFDAVYVLHFKCNRRRIVDYPNMWGYVKEIYQLPGVAETVNMEHIVKHYHMSHPSINQFRIVPINPIIDFNEKHGRDKL